MADINLLTGEGTSDLESEYGMKVDLLSDEIGITLGVGQAASVLAEDTGNRLSARNGCNQACLESDGSRGQFVGEKRRKNVAALPEGGKQNIGIPNTAEYDTSISKNIRANAIQLSKNKAGQIQQSSPTAAKQPTNSARNNHEAINYTRKDDHKDLDTTESGRIKGSSLKGPSTTCKPENQEEVEKPPTIKVTRDYYNLCLEFQKKFGDISPRPCSASAEEDDSRINGDETTTLILAHGEEDKENHGKSPSRNHRQHNMGRQASRGFASADYVYNKADSRKRMRIEERCKRVFHRGVKVLETSIKVMAVGIDGEEYFAEFVLSGKADSAMQRPQSRIAGRYYDRRRHHYQADRTEVHDRRRHQVEEQDRRRRQAEAEEHAQARRRHQVELQEAEEILKSSFPSNNPEPPVNHPITSGPSLYLPGVTKSAYGLAREIELTAAFITAGKNDEIRRAFRVSKMFAIAKALAAIEKENGLIENEKESEREKKSRFRQNAEHVIAMREQEKAHQRDAGQMDYQMSNHVEEHHRASFRGGQTVSSNSEHDEPRRSNRFQRY